MPSTDPLKGKILSLVDRDRLIELCSGLANTVSLTGEEKAVSLYIGTELERLGFTVKYQEVEPDRPNVIGTLHGSGGGPILMFNAHMDHYDVPQPTEVNEHAILGRGLFNMKAAFACYIMAVEMLQRAKVSLKGDIIISGVVGEMESAPIDEYSGNMYRGGGIGARYLMDHGVTADACILGEPTGMKLRIGSEGLIYCQVKIASASDVILKGANLVRALKEWEPEYQRKYQHPLMLPQLDVGAINGGHPPRSNWNPTCSLYIYIRTLPNTHPLEVRRAIESICASVLDKSDTYWEVDLFLSTMGSEMSKDEPIVRSVATAHKDAFESEVEFPPPAGYAISNDGSRYMEYGIPTVTYGPGFGGRRTLVDPYAQTTRRDWTTNPLGTRKGVSIENLIKCAQLYALTAFDICNMTLEDYQSARKSVPWFMARSSTDFN